ncbi:DNA-binding protein WhiA [Thermincola potens]|uniref:Probable cell division protein WhiA n=1 Tax=Thermincola potens (strain JR) TaxID=635013 RepID=D5XC98_THEPJ|nr:DNA-binding protein WhiA [Thermincola potens]ADG83550.1 protein of unknown function DUF199 [Thermincola potens JR]
MSFSTTTKNELARIKAVKRCCQLAELAAIIKLDGLIQISGNHKMSLHILSENAAVARKVFAYLKSVFGVQTEILVRKKQRLKKNNVYTVRVLSQQGVREVLREIGIIDSQGHFADKVKASLLTKDCCRRAFLRGVFLGGGSVNNPEGTYHLEILISDADFCDFVCAVLHSYHLPAKVSRRKNWFVIYLKGSDEIVKLLNLMGAHSALLNFENVRIYKDMRNQVNRLVNCETANLNKTVDAALHQLENIKVIDEYLGLGNLPPNLKQIAELRLKYPDSSLKELGEMLDPKVSKSGVNHRFRRLQRIAEDLKAGKKVNF